MRTRDLRSHEGFFGRDNKSNTAGKSWQHEQESAPEQAWKATFLRDTIIDVIEQEENKNDSELEDEERARSVQIIFDELWGNHDVQSILKRFANQTARGTDNQADQEYELSLQDLIEKEFNKLHPQE